MRKVNELRTRCGVARSGRRRPGSVGMTALVAVGGPIDQAATIAPKDNQGIPDVALRVVFVHRVP